MTATGDYLIPAIDVADAILRHARERVKVARRVRPLPELLEDT